LENQRKLDFDFSDYELRIKANSNGLEYYLIFNKGLFKNFEIECNVRLNKDALFDVILRSTGEEEYKDSYIARFDSRITKDIKMSDRILIWSNKRNWWDECNPKTKTSNSPPNQIINMKIVAIDNKISLYRNNVIIDSVNNAAEKYGKIGICAETQDVYIKDFRIKPL